MTLMYEDLADHPFSRESIARESGEPDSTERAWSRWVDKAEALLGHDLDGNDVEMAGCGYSMDESYDKFGEGMTPEEYVALVKARDRYVGEFQGR
jgi:hypothetical protein